MARSSEESGHTGRDGDNYGESANSDDWSDTELVFDLY